MIKNSEYIKLDEVLSRVLRHPLLLNVSLEAAILYAVDFISLVGMPDMYTSKEAEVEINKFKGQLPCDLISINQVMELNTHSCLRSTTDTFMPDPQYADKGVHSSDNKLYSSEYTFKTLGNTIYTSFEHGKVKVSYLAMPVDDNGEPLILDNPTYLKALELYIKKEVFTILFDLGKLLSAILLNTLQEYAWRVGLLQSEMTIPSESEMESIARHWTSLVETNTHFDSGFRNLGNRNYIRRH